MPPTRNMIGWRGLPKYLAYPAPAGGPNKVALENAVYAPRGMLLRHYAWRKKRQRHCAGASAAVLGRQQDGVSAWRAPNVASGHGLPSRLR